MFFTNPPLVQSNYRGVSHEIRLVCAQVVAGAESLPFCQCVEL